MNLSTVALVSIDYQCAFDHPQYWGARNNAAAEANAAQVLDAFRRASLPVIHIVHDSTSPTSILCPGQPGNDQMAFARAWPNEPIVRKRVNSGFIGTDLEDRLRAGKVEHVVLMGISTDHCVSTTTRMAANLGFEVSLVGDACFTFDRQGLDRVYPAETVHQVELAILAAEFATIVSAVDLIGTLRSSSPKPSSG